MIQLKLRNSKATRALLPKFNKFLVTHEMAIVAQPQNNKEFLEVLINARLFGQVQYVTNLAKSFFDKEIIEVSTSSPIFYAGLITKPHW